MSKNRITKMFLMGLALILTGIVCMLGVMAITDSKLVNFKLGTKYEPAFNIEVYTTTIYNQNETKSLVFKSVNPSEVNYNAHYIDSVTNDTILFKTENLVTDDGIVVLTIVNNENKALQVIINKGAQVEVIDAGAEKAISVEIGTTNLGLFLFSLQIVEYAPYGASYNLSGCSLISGPEIIASETTTSEIILQANDADFTKWTISATSGEIETEYIWDSALMKVKVLLKNVTEATTLTARAEIDYWDGTAEAFPYGNGTEENPYLIRNGKHLHYLADVTNAGTGETLNKHYKMMNNIYLNEGTFGIDNETDFNPTYNGSTTIPAAVHQWEPIGYGYIDESYASIPVTYFEGVFNGNNFEIQGMYINTEGGFQGLFALTSENAIVKNLGVINSFVSSGRTTSSIVAVNIGIIENCFNKSFVINNGHNGPWNTAGIAAENCRIIKNCINYGTIKGLGNTAGIVGNTNNDYSLLSYEQVIDSCYNYGKIIGTQRVAGIVGVCEENKLVPVNATIKNCHNYGNISGTGYYVAGIAGYMKPVITKDSITTVGSVEIIDCSNSGEINGTSYYVAGVVGQNNAGEITTCHNTGAVTGGANYTAGVCGGATSTTITNADSTTTTYTPTISNCWNSGEINGTGSYVAGVVGYNTAGEITNCHNTGAVTGGASNVGGVCGYAEAQTITNADSTTTTYTPTITNCWNSGEINGTKEFIGGVCGFNNRGNIDICYNIGSIYTAVSSVGGIAGYQYNYGLISNSWNAGNIKSDSTTSNACMGGIVGLSNFNCMVRECYNIGDVLVVNSSSSYVGGIVGSNAGTVDLCYNTGIIKSSGSNTGGVIGHNYNVVVNSYNTGYVIGKNSASGICSVDNTKDGGQGMIINCYNIGTISGATSGGICGNIGGSSTYTASIKNCYNYGGVIGSIKTGAVVANIGSYSSVTATYYWSAFCSTGIGSGSGTATAVTASNYTTAMNALNSNVNTNNSNASNVKWLKWQIDATGCPSFVE